MKLEYKILWFEDQFDQMGDNIERLEELIVGYGFIPLIERYDKISKEEIEQLSDELDAYNPYDLILFDYNLGSDSEDGVSIAKTMRNSVYIDMIFYSSKSHQELRQLLFDENVDGVFIANRSDFYDNVEPIIEDQIKKISDINNIRGVVMSSTSSFDLNLRSILVNIVEKFSDEDTDKLLKNIIGRVEGKLEERKERIQKVTSVKEAISNPLLTEFEDIRVTLRKLANSDLKDILADGELIQKMQHERNKLAHQIGDYRENGKMYVGKGDKEKEYNFDEFTRVRSELLEATKIIDSHTP